MTTELTNGLSPCPFCGAGETILEVKTYWTGMRSEPTHTEIKHWCNKGTIDGAYLTIKGKTEQSAIDRWNHRSEYSGVENKD